MKPRLFLFLFFACTLLAGRAMAQGCSTDPIHFPQPGAADKQVPSGTCIANADSDSPTGQGGRLRWDDATSGGSTHQLELFDSDDGGALLWCANSANSNGGSSGPTNCLHPTGAILCLQQDGNMVIYKPTAGGPSTIDCGRDDNDGGQPVWASGTEGPVCVPFCCPAQYNDGSEELRVGEDFFDDSLGRTLHGDRALIHDTTYGVIWASIGYSD